jgi:MFS family permease
VVARFLRAWADVYRGLPAAVWLQAGAALVNRCGTMVLPFLALYATRELGLGAADAGRLLGLYGIGAIFGSYLGGWLCDRWGAVRVEIVSLAANGLGFLVLPFLRDPRALAVALPIVALAVESFRPALLTAAAQASGPAQRARSLAFVRFAVNLGMALGPVVGGLLASIDYLWLFVVDGGTCWLAAVFLAVLVAPRTPASSASERRAAAALARSPWRDRPFLALMVLVCVQATIFFQILGTFPLYLGAAYRLDEAQIGAVLGVNAAIIAFVEMPLVKGIEGLRASRVMGVGAMLVCVGFGLLPLGATVPFVVFTVVVWTIGEMLSMPMTNALVSRRAEDVAGGAAGRYMGIYTQAWSVAFVLAPTLGTSAYARWGGDVVWASCALLAVPLGLGFLIVARRLEAPVEASRALARDAS